jgi:acetoin utilization protein AcuB
VGFFLDVSTVKISEVMTKMPRCIGLHQPLLTAVKWMDELKVRHLPVREAGKIVGIVSDRDLGLMAGMSASGKKEQGCKIEDAMTSAVLTVFESQTVKEVTEKMLAQRVGSAIVTDNSGVITGIFTDTDALKILSGNI